MKEQSKPWYVEQRGQLLAQDFLLEIGAKSVASLQPVDIGIDYMAFFEKDDESLIIIAVELKATQRELTRGYAISSSIITRLKKLNVPALILVVDVKLNEIGFVWAHEAITSETSFLRDSAMIRLRTSTPEEKEKLNREILSY